MKENQQKFTKKELDEIEMKFTEELKEGKHSMRTRWLPELGEIIALRDFHEQVENEEIVRARVILGHFPHAADGLPYDPRDRTAWALRKSDNSIVYTIIPFSRTEVFSKLEKDGGDNR